MMFEISNVRRSLEGMVVNSVLSLSSRCPALTQMRMGLVVSCVCGGCPKTKIKSARAARHNYRGGAVVG